jgi:hypothetical protein
MLQVAKLMEQTSNGSSSSEANGDGSDNNNVRNPPRRRTRTQSLLHPLRYLRQHINRLPFAQLSAEGSADSSGRGSGNNGFQRTSEGILVGSNGESNHGLNNNNYGSTANEDSLNGSR